MSIQEQQETTTQDRQPQTEIDSDIVWGAVAIGRVINRTPRMTFYLLKTGKLPAKQIGGRWGASRRALLRMFEAA